MAKNTGKNVVVVGTQWGDEGKGKIVDWLTDEHKVLCVSKGATMQGIRWWLAKVMRNMYIN